MRITTNRLLLITIIITGLSRLLITLSNPHIIFSMADLYRGTVTKEIISGMPFHEYSSYSYWLYAWGHFIREILDVPLFILFKFSYVAKGITSFLWFYLTAFVWYRIIRDFIDKFEAQIFLIFFLLMPSFGFFSSFNTGHYENLLPIGALSYLILSLTTHPANRHYFIQLTKIIICLLLFFYSGDICIMAPVFFLYLILSYTKLPQRKYLYFLGLALINIIFIIIIFKRPDISNIWSLRSLTSFTQQESNFIQFIYKKLLYLFLVFLPKLFIYNDVYAKIPLSYLLYFFALTSFIFTFYLNFFYYSYKRERAFLKIHNHVESNGLNFFISYYIFFAFFEIYFGMFTLGKASEPLNYRYLIFLLIPSIFFLSYLFKISILYLYRLKKNIANKLFSCIVVFFIIFHIAQCSDKFNFKNFILIKEINGYSYYAFGGMYPVNTDKEMTEIKHSLIFNKLKGRDKLNYYFGKVLPTRPDKLFFLNQEYLEDAKRDDLKALICGINIGWYFEGLQATKIHRRKSESLDFYYQTLLQQQDFIKNIFKFLINNKYFIRGIGWGATYASFEFYENIDLCEIPKEGFNKKILDFIVEENFLFDFKEINREFEDGKLLFLNWFGLNFDEKIIKRLLSIENELLKNLSERGFPR